MAVGGGVDIAVSEHFGIRLVEADYVLTRFGNNFTGGNNSQSNFRDWRSVPVLVSIAQTDRAANQKSQGSGETPLPESCAGRRT
jgi:hypothetical protein